jgi:hypothetical protein
VDDTKAGRAAHLLIHGDRAARTGDMRKLGEIVRSLEMAGARPQAEDADDVVARWRSMLPQESAPLRGRVLGPGYRRGTLDNAQSVDLDQLFLSGERAEVALATDPARSVRLIVKRPDDKVVCNDASRPIRCSWMPLATQRYRISITNDAGRQVRYYLTTN